MRIFRFVQKVFFLGLTILSDFTNASSLSCILMKNQECKVRPKIIDINSSNPIFYPFSIKIVIVVAIVTILMTHMQESTFLML